MPSSISLAKFYKGFSCPYVKFDDDFMQIIAAERARWTIQRLLEKHHHLLRSRSPGLECVLETALNNELKFETAWDLAWGEAEQTLSETLPSNILNRLAALALHIQASDSQGVRGWSTELDSPVGLRWGNWQLARADWISVSSRSNITTIETRLRDRKTVTHFRKTKDGYRSEEAAPLLQIDMLQHQLSVLRKRNVNPAEFEDIHPKDAVNASRNSIAARFRVCFEMLEACAPEYLEWVDRIVRYVVLFKQEGERLVSGTNSLRPATILMSFAPNPVALAEMFVHESSHLYFNTITWLRPPDNGTDPKLYYSPIKKMGRPIHWILIAYHAFANVLLFYRRCLATNVADRAYCLRQERRLVRELKQLEAHLRETTALTSSGRALWLPLSREVRISP